MIRRNGAGNHGWQVSCQIFDVCIGYKIQYAGDFRQQLGRLQNQTSVLQDTAFTPALGAAKDLSSANNYVAGISTKETQEWLFSRAARDFCLLVIFCTHHCVDTTLLQQPNNGAMHDVIKRKRPAAHRMV